MRGAGRGGGFGMMGRFILLPAALIALVVSGCASSDRSRSVGNASIADRALLASAAQGRADVARYALEQGANVDVRDSEHGRTALMLAAERGDLQVMTVLLDAGADVDARSEDHWTALIHAVSLGNIDAINLLLRADADTEIHEGRYGFTPLLIAALLARTDAIAALLNGGADIDARDSAHEAPAIVLSAGSRDDEALQAVAELLVRGADPDGGSQPSVTPLIAATGAGNLAVANLLLSEGANPNTRSDTDGQTALGMAASDGRLAEAQILLRSGADPNVRAVHGEPPLLLAVADGYVEIAELLLRTGANIDASAERDGSTALILAAGRGDLPMVDLLLSSGANIYATANGGLTARLAAERREHGDVVRRLDTVLLQSRAIVEGKSPGEPASP